MAARTTASIIYVDGGFHAVSADPSRAPMSTLGENGRMSDSGIRISTHFSCSLRGAGEADDDAVPRERHPRSRRSARASRRGCRALHAFRWRVPINALNRDIIARLEAELREGGIDLPVYFGNRNWHPMVEDTVARMRDDGVPERARVSHIGVGRLLGVSSVRRGHRAGPGRSGPRRTDLEKLRQYYDHPLMVAAFADAIRAAREQLRRMRGTGARLVFTAHSVPLAADENAGPPAEGGNLYSRQVAMRPSVRRGGRHRRLDWLAVALRTAPQVPWLDPTSAITSTRLRRRARPR
ncbi:hypothetical protein GS571_05255 [Rhodococcus hoagii]|nr:hypothetical protein [Prescottella equi]